MAAAAAVAPPAADGELVQLWVYDLSGGMARTFSQMLLGRQIEAIYHTSVVIGGIEHYFGHGINIARAGFTPFGRPIQKLDLGHTHIPEEMRAELLADLGERYTPQAYNLWSNNCNSFSDELAQLLCGRGVPEHITGLPAEVLATPFGQMIAPMLSGLEQQLRGMPQQQAFPPQAAAFAAAALAPPQPSRQQQQQQQPVASAAAVEVATELAAGAAAGAAPAPRPAHAADEQAAAAAAPVAAEAAADEAPALHSAEVEIEAAVAEGMMAEAEAQLEALHLPPGSPPASAAAAAATAGGEAKAGADAGAAEKLATELAVGQEYRRIVAAGGVGQHEAAALALERVAVAQERERALPGASGPGGAELAQQQDEHGPYSP